MNDSVTSKQHWKQVYSKQRSDQLGWYKPHLSTSLDLITKCKLNQQARIIDIGGGASTLVDDLLDSGFEQITVMDIAQSALDQVRCRLSKRACLAKWLVGDITTMDLPPNHYDLWHDRAVFHFLTDADSCRRYIECMRQSLKSNGHIIFGTFSLEAPKKCSGLPVCRYDINKLHSTLGQDLILREHKKELHLTPGGVEQMYLYCHFQKPD